MRYFLCFLLVKVGLSAFTLDESSTQLLLSTNPDPINLEIFVEDRPGGSMAHTAYVDGRMNKEQFNQLFNQIQSTIAPFYPDPLDLHSDSGYAIMVRGRTLTGFSYGVYPFTVKGLAYVEVSNKIKGRFRIWAVVLENRAWSQRYYKDGRPFYLIIGEQLIDDYFFYG